MVMRLKYKLLAAFISVAVATGASAQSAPKTQSPPKTKTTQPSSRAAAPRAKPTTKPKAAQDPAARLSAKQQFVMNVVRSAVALPQADQQDRLRVLVSAANVVRPVDSKVAKRFAREGTRIEADLIARGEAPAASMIAAGHFDCASAPEFVAAIPPDAVALAETSLIGLVNMCSKKVIEPMRRKLETAVNNRILAPRALLATMESVGIKSPWSQRMFVEMFDTLPSNSEKAQQEAPNYAAMYSRVAPQVDVGSARAAGVNFLEWLDKLNPGNERQLAINISVPALKNALGEEDYEELLRRNVIVAQVARSAGQAAEIEHPYQENVSVLAAMSNRGADRVEEFREMPASLRARESASHGFAAGTGGDRKLADRYFDSAFAAADEVWANRGAQPQAPSVVEEVAQAAAHVDAVDALTRAQRLTDPTAQAIGMLAVARVVMAQQDEPPVPPSRTPQKSTNPIR